MGRRRRRRHSAEFKAAVIEECLRPGVSIAAVALAHGLNANMLRKWVIDGEHRLASAAVVAPPALDTPPTPTPTFVPLALSSTGVSTLTRGPTLSISVAARSGSPRGVLPHPHARVADRAHLREC